METKELNIKAPEGFVIDIDNSDLTKGIVKFKKQNTKPRSWEEFCKNYPVKEGEAWISGIGEIEQVESDRLIRAYPNYCTSKEEAEAFLALMQLRQLRKAWVENDPIVNEQYYNIVNDKRTGRPNITYSNSIESNLSFSSEKVASLFLYNFYDLIKQAKILL